MGHTIKYHIDIVLMVGRRVECVMLPLPHIGVFHINVYRAQGRISLFGLKGLGALYRSITTMSFKHVFTEVESFFHPKRN